MFRKQNLQKIFHSISHASSLDTLWFLDSFNSINDFIHWTILFNFDLSVLHKLLFFGINCSQGIFPITNHYLNFKTFMIIYISSGEATQWNDSLKIFKAIEAEDMSLLKECLFLKEEKDCSINDSDNRGEPSPTPSPLSETDSMMLVQVLNLRDSSGLTPLLFAADRGLCQVKHPTRTWTISVNEKVLSSNTSTVS